MTPKEKIAEARTLLEVLKDFELTEDLYERVAIVFVEYVILVKRAEEAERRRGKH